MTTALRWTGKAVAAGSLIIGLWFAVTSDSSSAIEGGIALIAGGLACMGGAYLIAWIIDGFAAPKA